MDVNAITPVRREELHKCTLLMAGNHPVGERRNDLLEEIAVKWAMAGDRLYAIHAAGMISGFPQKVWTYGRISAALRDYMGLPSGEAEFKMAADLAATIDDHFEKAWILCRLARISRDCGFSIDPRALLSLAMDSAFEIREAGSRADGIGEIVETSFAVLTNEEGTLAISDMYGLFARAIECASTLPGPESTAGIIAGIASMCRKTGARDSAAEIFGLSIAVASRFEDPVDRNWVIAGLCGIYSNSDDLPEIRLTMASLEKEADEMATRADSAWCHAAIASCRAEMGQVAEASAGFRKAFDTCREEDDVLAMASTMSRIADLYVESGLAGKGDLESGSAIQDDLIEQIQQEPGCGVFEPVTEVERKALGLAELCVTLSQSGSFEATSERIEEALSFLGD